MKKHLFLLLLFCLLIAPVYVSAMEVNPEDFGAIVNDGLDDSAAIQAAVNEALEVGGGRIIFPSGRLLIRNSITIVPDGYTGAEIRLQGNRGSVLEVSAGINSIIFYAGNLNVFTLEDLVIVGKNVPGDSPDFYDTLHVVFSNYVHQTNISRCLFYGIAVPDDRSIIYVGNTDAKITDSQFDGSLGQYPNGSVIKAENPRGLTVSRTTFLDYANFHGEYLSKSPGYTGSWISVKGTGANFNANGIRRIVIEDSRFDEAAAAAISIENVPWVNISGISVNVNGASPGKGIYIKNVDHAKVEQSWFGYTNEARPALDLLNVKVLEVSSLRFTGGVYFWKKQNVTSTSVRFCEQCR